MPGLGGLGREIDRRVEDLARQIEIGVLDEAARRGSCNRSTVSLPEVRHTSSIDSMIGRRLTEVLRNAELIVKLAEHLGPVERHRKRETVLLNAAPSLPRTKRRPEPILLVLLGRLRLSVAFAARLDVGPEHRIVVELIGLDRVFAGLIQTRQEARIGVLGGRFFRCGDVGIGFRLTGAACTRGRRSE